MVGVRTSNRCDNCRKRKKKCDEQKPSCSECIRGGWTCPGYETQWKFVDETRRLAEHFAGRKYVYDEVDLNLEEVQSRYVDEDMKPDGTVVERKYIHFLQSTTLAVPRYHETNRLVPALVYCLESKVEGTLIPLRTIGSFFEFVPARLGRNAALDDAVSCLCAIYCGSPSALYNLSKDIYQSYVRALSSLRGCLSDTSLRMELETLCASILLQMCELVVNVDRGEWSYLARGTAFLLYSRGVHRYTSAFEYAMLDSQLPFVLGQSVKFKEHCFLRSPDWQALLRQSPVWPFQISQPQILNLRSRLCGILVDLSSLILHYSAINEDLISQAGCEERLDLLIHRACIIFDDVKKWLEVEAEPLFLSHDSSRGISQEHISYPDILCGVLDCVSNTALLAVDKILRFLYHTRLRSNNLAGRTSQQGPETSQLCDDPEIIERRRQRVIKAFKFVQRECKLAAKPLEFGLQQIQFSGSG